MGGARGGRMVLRQRWLDPAVWVGPGGVGLKATLVGGAEGFYSDTKCRWS